MKEWHLQRRDGVEPSFRNAEGKPAKETLANLSVLPAEAIAAIRAVLAGKTLVDVAEAFEITRSLPHGHVAAVHAMAQQTGVRGATWPGRAGTRPGAGADRFAGGAAQTEAVHPVLVG